MNLPNKLTVLRVLLIPVFLVLFFMANAIPYGYLWALLAFGVAAFTDFLDGAIARKHGLITDFGKLMDPLADKLLVMAAMVCFVAINLVHPVIVILILAREFLVTSIRLVAAGRGVVIAADGWGKAKTIFQMLWICYGLLLKQLSQLFTGMIPSFLYWIYLAMVAIVTLLTVVSGVNYTWKNRILFADA